MPVAGTGISGIWGGREKEGWKDGWVGAHTDHFILAGGNLSDWGHFIVWSRRGKERGKVNQCAVSPLHTPNPPTHTPEHKHLV